MKYKESKKWLCKDCNHIFYSSDLPNHNLDYCPICKTNAVDHEDLYIRIIGNVEEVK